MVVVGVVLVLVVFVVVGIVVVFVGVVYVGGALFVVVPLLPLVGVLAPAVEAPWATCQVPPKALIPSPVAWSF